MCHLRGMKCQLPFRLLVAALTFVAGLAAFTLWNLSTTPNVPAPAMMTPALVAPRVDYSRQFPATRVVSGGILNGKAIDKPAPSLPAAAKSASLRSTVVVSVRVDEGGRVEAAWAVSGHPLFQQCAVEAARAARFAPTRLDGRPVKVEGLLTYDFD